MAKHCLACGATGHCQSSQLGWMPHSQLVLAVDLTPTPKTFKWCACCMLQGHSLHTCSFAGPSGRCTSCCLPMAQRSCFCKCFIVTYGDDACGVVADCMLLSILACLQATVGSILAAYQSLHPAQPTAPATQQANMAPADAVAPAVAAVAAVAGPAVDYVDIVASAPVQQGLDTSSARVSKRKRRPKHFADMEVIHDHDEELSRVVSMQHDASNHSGKDASFREQAQNTQEGRPHVSGQSAASLLLGSSGIASGNGVQPNWNSQFAEQPFGHVD